MLVGFVQLTFFFAAMSGSFGGVAYWAVPFPFDTIKSMMQTDPLRYKGKNAPRVFFEHVSFKFVVFFFFFFNRI